MRTVLVTGASGQLGKCFQKLAQREEGITWLFMNSSELDITSSRDLKDFFKSKSIDYCINCAAYTNVEKAESEQKKAFQINAEAPKGLAEICKKNHIVLFHFSTDYVFDGTSKIPYCETDPINPINVYGASKLKGENYIRDILTDYFIFRTSWLYSEFGHNFFKTVLNKAEEKATLNITTAQTGTPTNANHLARLVLMLIKEKNTNFGLYHFSNSGETTWYGFTNEILKVSGHINNVQLHGDNSYQTIAARPNYSVLDKTKLLEAFKTPLEAWDAALLELYKSGIQD